MEKKRVVKKPKKIRTVFQGECWSTDDSNQYSYKVILTKANAKRLVKLMDIYKELLKSNPDIQLHELSAWDSCVQIFDDNEVICDVCKVRVESNGVLWELKNKYSTDGYETEDLMREDIEAVANM